MESDTGFAALWLVGGALAIVALVCFFYLCANVSKIEKHLRAGRTGADPVPILPVPAELPNKHDRVIAIVLLIVVVVIMLGLYWVFRARL